jgi:integrase
MSVYKSKNTPCYVYNFKVGGRRFYGSTGTKSKREAERVEADLKRQAREQARRQAQAHENGPLTLDVAAGRYWQEVGQHHAGNADTWRDLERLVAYFGPGKLLADITDDHVAKLVMWHRAQRVVHYRKKPAKEDAPPPPLISPATVNRSTTEVLKKLFTRAKRAWGYTFKHEPRWKEHMLKEPEERVRELHGHEAEALDQAVRSDYEPWLSFARATGLRLRETLITWSQVNWQAGQIVTRGKGGKLVTTPITPTVRAILEPLKGQHPESVFTYVAERTRVCPRTGVKVIKGLRYPITYSGAKSLWKRTRKRSGVKGLRFHDLRHDVGTKLLRATGNLKLVQRALNHADLKTTTRYAHVLDEEVGQALDLVAKSRRSPGIFNQQCQNPGLKGSSETATPSHVENHVGTPYKVA